MVARAALFSSVGSGRPLLSNVEARVFEVESPFDAASHFVAQAALILKPEQRLPLRPNSSRLIR